MPRALAPALPAGLALIPLLGSTAWAQEGPNTVEQVVVTARGRAERLAETPASLAVLPVETREIQRLDEIPAAAPGVFVIDDQDPGTNIISVRGVSTDRLQAASIAYVVDGLPLADTELFTERLFDIARFEVLKGPQGALFGKNAAGGAFNVLTRSPSPEPGGSLRLGYGSGNTRELEAVLTGPLAPGVSGRLAVFGEATDGLIENRTLGRKADFYETWNGRGRLSADLGPRYRLEAMLSAHAEEGGAAYASSGNITGRTGGALEESVLEEPIGDYPGRAKRWWGRGAVRLVPRQADAGGFTLLVAYDDYHKRFEEELDYRPGLVTVFGFPFPDGLQPIRQPIDLSAWTGEARWVSSAAARVRTSFGVFAQDLERERIDDFGPLLFGAPAPRYLVESLQTAAFGQAETEFGPATVSLALRYDRDERSQAISSTATGAGLGADSAVFDALQPKATAAFKPRPGWLAWAAYAEGFRTGGFNPPPGPDSPWEQRFEPETVRSLETGLKLLRPGFYAEVAAYLGRISDYQSYTFLENQSVTLNLGQVRTAGLEAAFEARRGDWRLSGSAALTDAEIEDYVAPDPLLPGALRDYSGLRPTNTPEHQFTLGLERVRGFGSGELRVRGDLNGVGRVDYTLDNVLHAPARVTLDGRAEAVFGRYTAAAFVRNAADERWAISAFGQTMLPLLTGLGPGGPFDTYTINRGREWGLSLEARF
ncbi:MAG: TonB-dependent receptor [Pseudomonadota bacterium]|nr:TonB-dependent receptor [Pseudomonadota bacterium]